MEVVSSELDDVVVGSLVVEVLSEVEVEDSDVEDDSLDVVEGASVVAAAAAEVTALPTLVTAALWPATTATRDRE